MTEMMRAFVMKGMGKVGFMEKPRPIDLGPNGHCQENCRTCLYPSVPKTEWQLP